MHAPMLKLFHKAVDEREKAIEAEKAAKIQMIKALCDALVEYEKSHVLRALTAENGATWLLVEAMDKDCQKLFRGYGSSFRESYLTDLAGHRIFRTHSYEGQPVSSDCWYTSGFCCSAQEAIDSAEKMKAATEWHLDASRIRYPKIE